MLDQVWIDTDVALGAPEGDVDDGFALAALLAAHRSGRLEILGVSTVFGNTTAARAQECAREICRRAGVSVPILRGAEKPGSATGASDAIAAVAPGANLLCLGPLTNLAAACRKDPGLPERASLLAVGGNLSSRGVLPPLWPFEFNFFRDREGGRFVLSRRWRSVTLYPLDVVRHLAVDRNRLRELAGASPMGAYLAQESERWLLRARWRYGAPRFPLWDLPAALDVAGLLVSRCELRNLSFGTRVLLGGSGQFRCLVSFDAEACWRDFLRLVGGQGSRDGEV